mmetsp:Transcript_21788/g.27769  ORF Transcript_21788/g.27769 Transcript_21788/m.27769 type:complete len:292 (-) Transcript_21788:34-909(-)
MMSGAEVAQPVQAEAGGCAIVSYDCNTKIMEYLIVHDADELVTSGVIGLGEQGEFGTILDSLPTATSPIFGSIRLTNSQIHALYTNQMYFQLYAQGTAFMRGNLNADWDYFIYLSGSNELPAVSTPAKGCGLARVARDNDEEDIALLFSIYHTVRSPLSLELRRGAEGTAGPAELVIDDFIRGETSSPIRGDLFMDDDDIAALQAEEFYFEIPSASHLIGEIRGQVRRLNPCQVAGISYSAQEETSVNVFSYFQSIDASRFSGRYNIIYNSPAASVSVFAWVSVVMLVILV